MTAKFESLLNETTALNEEAKDLIREAWEGQLKEAREEITSELREEFAQKYEHDKAIIVESMDKFLNDKIRGELEEFAQDKKELAAERVKYKTSIKEHSEMLDKFVTENLAREVKELIEERKSVKENVQKLEDFMIEQLAKEIKEFRADREALVKQRVKMVQEGKQELVRTKREFISRASKLIEENIDTVLRKEIQQYRDDINAARENDFGRRIFESFVAEYMTSYLNEGSEVSKLQKLIQQKEQELKESAKALAEKETLVENTKLKLNAANDRISRERTLNDLLAPLSKDKRQVMKELLESVKTDNLRNAYNKYLPAVLNESAPKTVNSKEQLTESRVAKTGDRASAQPEQSASVDDLNKIKILAGIK